MTDQIGHKAGALDSECLDSLEHIHNLFCLHSIQHIVEGAEGACAPQTITRERGSVCVCVCV